MSKEEGPLDGTNGNRRLQARHRMPYLCWMLLLTVTLVQLRPQEMLELLRIAE
jgi:hypothetical protein